MRLDQKQRSLFAGNLYRPATHHVNGEDVIYLCDMPYELEGVARAWLVAQLIERMREGPRGLAVTLDTWDEMLGWMLDQLGDALLKLPLRDAAEIQAVVFDAFGTLCQIKDPRNPYKRLIKEAAKHGEDPAAARRLVMTKRLTLREAAYQLSFFDEETIASLEADLAAELKSIELYPEVLDVLHGWKERGVRIAVGSNLATPYAAPLLKLLPIELDVYGWSFEIEHLKPDFMFYNQIAQRLGVDAARGGMDTILWIGDSLVNDHNGPLGGGMRSILIRRDPEQIDPKMPFSRPLMVLPELPHPNTIRGLA
jgi:FMN phosphatase YigB (HAD superfamily)